MKSNRKLKHRYLKHTTHWAERIRSGIKISNNCSNQHMWNISESSGPILTKFGMYDPWDKGVQSCSNWGWAGPTRGQKQFKLGRTGTPQGGWVGHVKIQTSLLNILVQFWPNFVCITLGTWAFRVVRIVGWTPLGSQEDKKRKSWVKLEKICSSNLKQLQHLRILSTGVV